MKDRPTVSAVMIVKNEAERIRACLTSIHGIVDEICVVDTGSTDGTMDILREFGCRIVESPWQRDFSLHRNEAFDMATGDWCLIIDGDEEIDEKARESFVAAMAAAAPTTTAIMCCVETRGDNGLTQRFFAQRLVRRGAYRYALPVHNQLIPVAYGSAREDVCREGLVISYYVGQMQTKADRSLPMLMELHEAEEAAVWARYGLKRPHDFPPVRAHAAFFITKTHVVMGSHREVLAWGAITEPLVGGRPNFAELWCYLYYSNIALGAAASHPEMAAYHNAEARAVLDRGIRMHPTFLDLRRAAVAQAALEWMRMGKTNEAQHYARVSASGLQYMGFVPEACVKMGIPIGWRVEPGAVAAPEDGAASPDEAVKG